MSDFTYEPVELAGSAKAYRVKRRGVDVGTVLRGTATHVWWALDLQGVRLTKRARSRIDAAERLWYAKIRDGMLAARAAQS